jgi:hypothetical protein
MGLIALGVVESAGDASLCEARFVDGLSDDEVMHLFRSRGCALFEDLYEYYKRKRK